MSCNGFKSKSNKSNSSDSIPKVEVKIDKDSILLELTNQILTSLKNKDFEKFSEFFHPILGVRFSAYAFIDTTKDLKFTSDKFLKQIEKSDKLAWGSYDGSGEPIELTVKEYFDEFVYSADFLNAEKVSLNEAISGGNTVNNIETAYKDCDFTESYFSGFNKEYEGLDWCSLRLVFKEYNSKYYLVGIIHGQWTI